MIYQKNSNKIYSDFAKYKNFLPTEKAGRHKSHSGLEKNIFRDIIKKLDLKKGDKFLDIGSGCGPLADFLVKFCNQNNIKITLCDIPDVIKVLKKKYLNYRNINYIENEFQKKNLNQKYNKILCYSVIQCVNNPRDFLKKILKILTLNGKALIGDIPNLNRKFRFLKSDFGKNFEKKRLKKEIKFNNFKSFLKSTKQNKLINDNFIKFVLNYSHKQNRNCFILKQPKELPFSFTREDILIEEI
tara:strand:- start:2260 stop:2988 length:729 start_codon:yes stop_codon:yes gene_type:complete